MRNDEDATVIPASHSAAGFSLSIHVSVFRGQISGQTWLRISDSSGDDEILISREQYAALMDALRFRAGLAWPHTGGQS